MIFLSPRIFRKVLTVITEGGFYENYVRLPDPAIIPTEISSNPRYSGYFDDVRGALDGTQIPLKVKIEDRTRFRNRKGYTSQNVLAACSFDLKFQYVLCGWEGSSHDASVLSDAR